MLFEDVVSTLQTSIAQTLGSEYMTKTGDLAALESYKIVDIGKDVLDSPATTETFCKSLISVIADIEIEKRVFSGDMNSIMVKNYDWGGFIERVYYGLSDVVADPTWNLVNGTSYDDHIFYKPNVSAKIFAEAKAVMTPISRPVEQVKEAFESWEKLNVFMDGIAACVKNTIELGLMSMKHMLVQGAIAVSDKSTQTAVHLLTDAKAAGVVTAETTATQAMNDEKFLTYCLQRIAETRSNMQVMSTAFNNKSIPTFTPENDSRMFLLNAFEKACRFKVKANTFNREDLAVGNYEMVTAWQGVNSGTSKFTFDTVSSVSISADTNNKIGIGTEGYETNGVICLLFDYKALGVCPYRRKVTGSYTASADFINEYHHLLVNMILDANYNIVAFIID